ncbi:unnamed protein product [Clonostachys rosea f. rosea IK726]|uniref:Uncharacterized protein n=1 Tax=Clonostachys rosea f. rosea IK726 TaxID=1349383 RepID=A0ACA9TG22_BIOOC|nr:unnamed protein product [Clonostachys rosea f. rosea IK726]
MSSPQLGNHLPYLRKTEGAWELIVDNEPYLILGAELHNSSMSSARHMESVWGKLRAMNINTVLGNVSWEDIEREEGVFDFTELDKVLVAARSAGLRMILLWFGSFKNGSSSYVPGWVKTNTRRFPRAQIRNEYGALRLSDNISIFHSECVVADTKAFTELQRHLAHFDSQRIVLMVQVQNEVGLLGDSRDRSPQAEKLFNSAVPDKLIKFLSSQFNDLHEDAKEKLGKFQDALLLYQTNDQRSWEDWFGPSVYTDELFMAYHYAIYVESIAAAGKQAYGIPLFTNAWLPKPAVGGGLGNLIAAGGTLPGSYPSGGPISNVIDIWHWLAPSLDFVAPDIYAADYTATCQTYKRGDRPLFIPEQRRDAHGARRLWEAIGSHQALGACPFGIDSLEPASFAYTAQYKLLASLETLILRSRQESRRTFGFYFDEFEGQQADTSPPIVVSFKEFNLSISRAFVLGKPSPGAGMIIEIHVGQYLLIGEGFKVEFKSSSATSRFTGILRAEEKTVQNAATVALRTERVLNGDETRSGKWVNMPSENPDYGDGFIPLLTPAGTRIVEVQVYSIDE